MHVSEKGGGWDCHVHIFDAAAPRQAGHYSPVHRPLVQIEAEAAKLGVHHLVLVQPSVYGSDNSLLLSALRVDPGRHRGVVVLSGAESDAELDAMHTAGVRGARLNLVSPVGESRPVAERFEQLAPRLIARAWHLQWYAGPAHLQTLASLHAGSGLVCVLDHMGGMHAGLSDDHAAWAALSTLAAQGAWIKLSGWYRLGAVEPYSVLLPVIHKMLALFGPHTVWGSDWPHTSFANDQMPAYASMWWPVVAGVGEHEAKHLLGRRPTIYG